MFHKQIIKIQNSGQARCIILGGNVYDLFATGNDLIQLIPYLAEKIKADNLIQIVYELNGPIRIKDEDLVKLKRAWVEFKTGRDPDLLLLEELKRDRNTNQVKYYGDHFDKQIIDSIGNPNAAFEFLRQLMICSRTVLKENLFVIVEAADMLLPAGNGDISSLNDRQLQRVCIVADWLGDPRFMNGNDTLILIAESRSLIHPRISRLPQVMCVDIPAPDRDARKVCLEKLKVVEADKVADWTAGLTLLTIQQLVRGAEKGQPTREEVVVKLEDFIKSQLGEDVVSFKKPEHKLVDCVGNSKLKKFLQETFIPRLKVRGSGAIPGAVAGGPIGGGKTYIWEAVAAEMDMLVLELKNIRSQWFGQTDVVVERLSRILYAVDQLTVFVDEADTQFGGVGKDVHETEKRLTGKIQALMSDPKLKGKVFWILMTARIHLLSPDIRRPGRVGDLIVPVLDPEGQDRVDFIRWVLRDLYGDWLTRTNAFDNKQADLSNDETLIKVLDVELPKDYSAASFQMLRSNLKFKGKFKTMQEILDEVRDFIQPAIASTRRYQTLQALVNCTRLSLLPDNVKLEDRLKWEEEIARLESKGITGY